MIQERVFGPKMLLMSRRYESLEEAFKAEKLDREKERPERKLADGATGPPEDEVCAKCERWAEPQELAKCEGCHKNFCNYCEFRMGGRSYCSRSCGEVQFFGGESSDDDAPLEE